MPKTNLLALVARPWKDPRVCRLVLVFSVIALSFASTSAAQDSTQLEMSIAADEAYDACVEALDSGRLLAASACFDDVARTHDGTTAALRARAARDLVRYAEKPDIQLRAGRGSPFMPGHMGLVTTQTGFGILNGAALAMILGQAPGADKRAATLAGGAGAVALGFGLGAGSWFLAERLELSHGDAQLLGSGTAWGTGLGLTLAPWMFSLAGAPWPDGALPPLDDAFEQALPLALVPAITLGWAGAVGGFAASRALELRPGQVSTVSTGGMVGLIAGFAATPFLEVLGFGDPILLGLAYFTSGIAGFAGGGLMASILRLEPWEIWIIDAATLVAAGVIGGIGVGLRAAGGPDPTRDVLMGTFTLLGTGAALTATTYFVSTARVERGDRAFALQMLGPPSLLVHETHGVALHMPLLGGRF